MSLKITFELEDKDLRYFKKQMNVAKSAAKNASESEIIASATSMMNEVKKLKTPEFVKQKVEVLSQLIAMLRDDEWPISASERGNVVSALAYFSEPLDIIPDDVPILGYIDDAIMIELVARELKHELDAFADFSRFRKGEAARKRNPNATREEYLESKRKALQSRMRRRRKVSLSRGTSRTRIRLF